MAQGRTYQRLSTGCYCSSLRARRICRMDLQPLRRTCSRSLRMGCLHCSTGRFLGFLCWFKPASSCSSDVLMRPVARCGRANVQLSLRGCCCELQHGCSPCYCCYAWMEIAVCFLRLCCHAAHAVAIIAVAHTHTVQGAKRTTRCFGCA